jgi:alkaline phosphatase D
VLRRRFISLLITGAAGLLTGWRSGRAAASGYGFRHGVASGDPLPDGVIIWTRISGATGEPIGVSWQVASDPEMRSILRSGVFTTGPERDYTVKVDVRGLRAGSRLYYRFSAAGTESQVGRTRTLPTGSPESVSFAVVSCSNYPAGYFHAYREIAKQDDLDAVVHLGDYLYEYGMGEYATAHANELGRIPDPVHETVTLGDYRRRHAQYKSDPDSRAMLAAHPLIAVWDDHEIANDAWHEGAENHGAEEGGWPARVDAAVQAYLEWMPVRASAEGGNTRIFREFRYGDLLALVMLDTRLHGRDRQPEPAPEMTLEEIGQLLGEPDRELLGPQQSAWLREAVVRHRDLVWQVYGQQVLVSPVRAPDLEPLIDMEGPSTVSRDVLEYHVRMSKANPPVLLDTWDGYPVARERFLAEISEGQANAVVLSGDLHTSLAGNLVPNGGDEPVAVEFMAPSVTSPGFQDYLPERHPGAVRDATLALNPGLAYMETDRRGWLRMRFDRNECVGEWHLLDGIRSRDYEVSVDQRLKVGAGRIAAGLQPSTD